MTIIKLNIDKLTSVSKMAHISIPLMTNTKVIDIFQISWEIIEVGEHETGDTKVKMEAIHSKLFLPDGFHPPASTLQPGGRVV